MALKNIFILNFETFKLGQNGIKILDFSVSWEVMFLQYKARKPLLLFTETAAERQMQVDALCKPGVLDTHQCNLRVQSTGL